MIATAVSNTPETFQRNLERAVKILKDGGCAEVFLFSSLVKGGGREDSDVDLAVRGCPTGSFFRLYGELMSVLDHRVDLVDLDAADPFTEYLTQKGTMRQLD